MGVANQIIRVGDRVVLDDEYDGIITNVMADQDGRPQTAVVCLAQKMGGESWLRLDLSGPAVHHLSPICLH